MKFLQILVWIASAASFTPPDNTGREFVLMFIENLKLGGKDVPLELYCTTQEEKPVNVHVYSPKWNSPRVEKRFTLKVGQVHKTLVDSELQMIGSCVSSKSILIKADAEIACYGANKQTLSNDVFLALPVDALGTDYYAMAYSPALVKTQLGIVSTVDSTNVKVTLPIGHGNVDVSFKGITYHAGDIINIRVQKYNTVQLQSSGDLTGAHIQSNNPVAVFSGNVKTNVGKGDFEDHLVEQLISSDRWGQNFVTAPIPGRMVGDVFKAVAREDNTVINVPRKTLINLNKGGVTTFELPSGQYSYITSTKPIMIAQFVKSQQNQSVDADPSMMMITPNEQFGSECTFATPEYTHPEYGNDQSFRYKNEFMIVTKKSDIQGLVLDGRPFPNTNWTDIQGTDLVGSYVTLSHGVHTVRHSYPFSTFGGYLYGHAYHESYGFPTGMRTAILYYNCTPTTSVPVHGIDCGGKIEPSNIGQVTNVTISQATNTASTQVATASVTTKISTHVTIQPLTTVTATTTKAGAPSTILAASTGPAPNTLSPTTKSAASITPPDNTGREFVLMFIENLKLGGKDVPLELYCTSQEKKPVNVQVYSPKWTSPRVEETFTLKVGQVQKTLVDSELQMTGSCVSSKSILIKADAEIACYGANKQTLSNDVYLALPVDALGTDYYAMAYSPASVKTQLGIVSTVDSTDVRVTLPVGHGNVDVLFNGITYHAGDVINIIVQKYDTVQLQSSGDLTGAHIETNNPVAVFSGNVKTNVGKGVFQDHLVEQLISSDRWGQYFVTAPVPGRTIGDIFKAVAREDNTVINVPRKTLINLNKGGVTTFELPSDQYSYITSTKPIMIAQFVKSQINQLELTDPSMMMITPNEQFGSECTFATPEYTHPEYGNDQSFRYKNEFMIVTKKSDIQGLVLDGKPFPNTNWKDIQGTDLVGSHVTLSHGVHTVRHPFSTFGGYLYGHAYHESYGFPTGMRTAILYSNCTPATRVPVHGIDCGGKIEPSNIGQVTNVTTLKVTNTASTQVTIASVITKLSAKMTTQPPTTVSVTTTKARVPSTTLAASTSPPPKTLPPTTTTCAVCAGPKFLCEKLYAPTPCPPPNNYCINTIKNHKDGTKAVDRACGSFDTCYREWFLGSSDNDKCRKLSDNDEQRLDFQCTFCCIKDNCNNPLHPSDDTLYKPV
ncbi:uncharacterized protein LOC123539868 isoform X2 [Mercenaria mercenaria]|uniref:uncharacterized protein LOC123539868 isoform X2 n=1 Tax=Mercenaria mercenaria TaxID=6596 RepID=UPI00234F2B8F|nr:uncharacterized protein LOC123539868 isoform X2 [Mercenaria mercenaria]